jgi:hypothetical protein
MGTVSDSSVSQNRDITLTPSTYMYLQNDGKNGAVSIYLGPALVNQTGQDRPVIYDHKERRYRHVSLEQAVQRFPRAEEGDYIILENPSPNT